MRDTQLDLFSERLPGAVHSIPAEAAARLAEKAGEMSDEALITAIPEAGMDDLPVLAAEAGRRRLAAAVPPLDVICRRFAGFGPDRLIPEQAASLQALGDIGGSEAIKAVVRVIARNEVLGPNLAMALSVAARLAAVLPADIVPALLRYPDPAIRAAACRCAPVQLEIANLMVDLLNDLHEDVHYAAACALGRMRRSEALPPLIAGLRKAPTLELVESVAPVADDDAAVLLGRVARAHPDLADAVLEALEGLGSPLAERIAAGLRKYRSGSAM